jgi:hypothetical protein
VPISIAGMQFVKSAAQQAKDVHKFKLITAKLMLGGQGIQLNSVLLRG